MNLLRIIFFIYISNLLSSPKDHIPISLCLSAVAGAGAGAALGYTPGGAVKLPGFQLCPGVPPELFRARPEQWPEQLWTVLRAEQRNWRASTLLRSRGWSYSGPLWSDIFLLQWSHFGGHL
jgi:hypothetical protein